MAPTPAVQSLWRSLAGCQEERPAGAALQQAAVQLAQVTTSHKTCSLRSTPVGVAAPRQSAACDLSIGVMAV